MLWSDEIQPILLKRYPGLSEGQLKQAHAYAYGGAVIRDRGYYPFGSKEFSNLVHYVRSGDLVRELLLESQDVYEYAFALGALSHYAADIAGHPAVNQSVAIEYPKLRAKFGKSVRHAQDKTAHLKTEFGFVRNRIQNLSKQQLKATQDAAYLGMSPKVTRECDHRQEAISRLVDRLKEREDGREVISKLFDRLAGLGDEHRGKPRDPRA